MMPPAPFCNRFSPPRPTWRARPGAACREKDRKRRRRSRRRSSEGGPRGKPAVSPVSFAPPFDERVLQTEQVEGTPDDEVHEVIHRLRAVVEARRQEEDRRSGLSEREHVLEVDRR